MRPEIPLASLYALILAVVDLPDFEEPTMQICLLKLSMLRENSSLGLLCSSKMLPKGISVTKGLSINHQNPM